MTLDLQAMKAAAREASQRPWHRQQVGSPGYYRIMVGEHNALSMSGDAGRANSAHIVAAQPAAVLALIERLERAEAELRQIYNEQADSVGWKP